MELFTNDFCQIEFYSSFVIIVIKENTLFTLDKATSVRKKLRSYYKKNDFVLITHRKYKHEVAEEVYKQGQLHTMKGLAIVSSCADERDKAMQEQQLYDKSFAFFETIEEAKSWATAYF